MMAKIPRGHEARIKFFRGNSNAFRLLRKTLVSDQCQFRFGASERKTISRLIKAGLITSHACPKGCLHASYSLTLAGRATCVAAELGLSFSQLCYLACARAAAQNSIFGESSFFVKDLIPIFGMLFPDVSLDVTRMILSSKGWLARRVQLVYTVAPRFEEHAALADELYRWIKIEYAERISESIQNPFIAKILAPPPRLQVQVQRNDADA